jgi:dihydroneopterin aldolase
MTMDRIVLTGLTFFGYHGVNPEERKLGQRFVVDLALEVDLGPAGRADDLTRTVNYAHVDRIVRDVVEGPPLNLIEAVAERIAAAILAQTTTRSVWVRVAKPWAPVAGMATGLVAVEIQRPASADPTPIVGD